MESKKVIASLYVAIAVSFLSLLANVINLILRW